MHPQDHPGGAKIILKYAGKDATSAYEPIHPPDALDKHLPREKHLGSLDSAAASAVKEAAQNRRKTKDELRVEAAHAAKPPVSRMLSLWDIEVRGRRARALCLAMYVTPPGRRTESAFIQGPRVLRFRCRRRDQCAHSLSSPRPPRS